MSTWATWKMSRRRTADPPLGHLAIGVPVAQAAADQRSDAAADDERRA